MFLEKSLALHIGEGERQITMLARALLSEFEPAYSDIAFYIGAVELAKQWEDYGYCFAEVMPLSKHIFDAYDMFHPLYGEYPTRNSLELSEKTSIALLGGINRGGKTTFLRTALAVQILFQIGYPVPAKNAKLSVVDNIMCVFARDEGATFGAGKLGTELSQLQSVMASINENGFFVFNEPLTATSPTECTFLSREILCAVKIIGARGVWVTHIHELHDDINIINSELPRGDIFSLRTATESDDASEFSILCGAPVKGSEAKTVFDKLYKDR